MSKLKFQTKVINVTLQILNISRLLKNTHLLRFPHPSSLRRTSKYASLLRILGALHLGIFEQPEENHFSSNLIRFRHPNFGLYLVFACLPQAGILTFSLCRRRRARDKERES